jgi:hypothetical protein
MKITDGRAKMKNDGPFHQTIEIRRGLLTGSEMYKKKTKHKKLFYKLENDI